MQTFQELFFYTSKIINAIQALLIFYQKLQYVAIYVAIIIYIYSNNK